MKLNLENVNKNIDKLVEEYHICENNNHYLFDGDLEDLFYDSNIKVGDTILQAKDWSYYEDCGLTGCKDGDYLETIELFQNGNKYLCQVFSNCCGDGLDYMLALHNVERVN